MTELIRKVVSCEVKEVSDRVLEFIGSTETVDRDGEVIRASGWDIKNFKKNPVFMWAHRYDQPPIGKAQKVWVDDNKLKFQIEFADRDIYEFADTIYKLYKGGFLHATSVGFMPDFDAIEEGDGEKEPRRTYTKQELLELSAVPVPSNPDALVQAREQDVITIKEFEQITKPEETEDYFRVPVPGEEGKHEGHRIRTIDISKEKGIKALYCGECKKNTTYLFSKEDKYGWTMESAREWVKEHEKQETYQCECIKCGYSMESEKHCRDIECPKCGGEMRRAERPGSGQEAMDMETNNANTITPHPKEISQAEIGDAFDYAKSLIEAGDLNDENKELMWDIVREIMRLTGGDIPDDIAGAVLDARKEDSAKEPSEEDSFRANLNLTVYAAQRITEMLGKH